MATRADDIELVLDNHQARHLLNILHGADLLRREDRDGRWQGARQLYELAEWAARDTGWSIDQAGRQFGCRLIMYNPDRGILPSRVILECIENIIKGTAGEWPMQLPASDDPEAMVAAIRALLDEHNTRLETAARRHEAARAKREAEEEARRRREEAAARRRRKNPATMLPIYWQNGLWRGRIELSGLPGLALRGRAHPQED